MKIIKPKVLPEFLPDYFVLTTLIERAARTCYKSEGKIKPGSAEELIKSCIRRGHGSVLEHGSITLRFITDRGVTHEIVRHRVGVAYSQESTRYCDYKDGEINFIEPWWYEEGTNTQRKGFDSMCHSAEAEYKHMRHSLGLSPQAARAALPCAVKTEIVMTANIREWRHILRLRCDPAAHPDMVRTMNIAKHIIQTKYPIFFEDL